MHLSLILQQHWSNWLENVFAFKSWFRYFKNSLEERASMVFQETMQTITKCRGRVVELSLHCVLKLFAPQEDKIALTFHTHLLFLLWSLHPYFDLDRRSAIAHFVPKIVVVWELRKKVFLLSFLELFGSKGVNYLGIWFRKKKKYH